MRDLTKLPTLPPQLVFTKTKVLSVKVATLSTFLIMVNTLDQTVLTQKLVPLLSKIRTKEPAVMVWLPISRSLTSMFIHGFQMATLLVQEAMGFKVDREAVAMAVLPQLWQMAMGPRALPFILVNQTNTDGVPRQC